MNNVLDVLDNVYDPRFSTMKFMSFTKFTIHQSMFFLDRFDKNVDTGDAM